MKQPARIMKLAGGPGARVVTYRTRRARLARGDREGAAPNVIYRDDNWRVDA